MAIIYLLRNKVNDKRYVGRTCKNIEIRWKEHVQASRTNVNCGMLIVQAIAKYGENEFERSVLEECENDVVGAREIFWINELGTHVSNGGYNLTFGGDGGMIGFKASDETRAKMSRSQKGKKRSPEACEKMRIKATGRKMSPEAIEKTASKLRGRKQRPEVIESRASKLRGRKMTQEQKEHLSRVQRAKNFKHNEESKRKISEKCRGKVPPNKGVPMSEETRRKCSLALKGKRIKGRTIQQIDLQNNVVSTFKSVMEASRRTGISTSSIWRTIHDDRPRRECLWRFVGDSSKKTSKS